MVTPMTAPPAPAPLPPLARPLTELRGVGPERAAQLARLELFTVADLLRHRPRRHEDRRHFCTIAELRLQEAATTRGRIVAMGTKTFKQGSQSVFEIILDDGTARLHCRWWNVPYMRNYFRMDDEVFVFGTPKALKPRTIDHPESEVIEGGEESSIHINRIAPVYPLTEGLPQRFLRALVWRALLEFGPLVPDPWPDLARVAGTPWPTLAEALQKLHFPEVPADIETGRRRLALDEFIELQRDILARRRRFEAKARGLPCAGDNRWMKPFLAGLGFGLTNAQTRVLRELQQDLGGAYPMRRLLQGDVGSGKTVVAGGAILMALESGYNAALMAPTEILAEQHFRTFARWFEPLGLTVKLRTGARKTDDDPLLANGATLTVGTHALIEAGYAPQRLGLVIIDEQHKFGVSQREELLRKGNYPHLLVMTATPIPRTLGLTLYGELDWSVLDELPRGRGVIKTFARTAERLPKVWDFLREKLTEGRQAYIVHPRVEDTGKGLKAVTKEFASLQSLLAPHAVGLLHGRLKSGEKEGVMAAFRDGTVKALLATPLIEVGLDVPNATVMVIENADQFGLAQLHQLRGRIGRGAHDSWCILVAGVDNAAGRAKLKILEESGDGFRIAEEDLKLRGPGELLGQLQSGAPDFRFGNLAEDGELVRLARELAVKLVPPPGGTA